MPIETIEILIIIIIITSLFVFSGISAIILVFRFQNRKLLYEKKLIEITIHNEEEKLKARLEMKDETLEILGKELHDNIGQLLNSAKLLIGVTQMSIPESPEALHIADETLNDAINELRSLSKSLNKEWLEQFNLFENIETEIKRVNASGKLKITLLRSDPIILDSDKKIILFRMIQETLQNAIKHANADKIDIQITAIQNSFSLIIQDNGIGFESNSEKGSGIMNIKQRARLLGGEAKWETGINQGTKVIFNIPEKI